MTWNTSHIENRKQFRTNDIMIRAAYKLPSDLQEIVNILNILQGKRNIQSNGRSIFPDRDQHVRNENCYKKIIKKKFASVAQKRFLFLSLESFSSP